MAGGSPGGRIDGLTTWPAGYRHGETLLPAIERFLGEQNIRRSRLAAIVVGTGPGRSPACASGLATAKGLAHGLGLPIVGISTAEALLAAAAGDPPVGAPVLLLPAGPSDRILVRRGDAADSAAGRHRSRTSRRARPWSPSTWTGAPRPTPSNAARPPARGWAPRWSRSAPPGWRPATPTTSRGSSPST